MMDKITLGRKAEDLAADYLQGQGYQIVERNFRCFCGEIDIIAFDGADLVFVEVRSKRSAFAGLPQETVTWPKQQRLRRLAQYYLWQKKRTQQNCRFDVVGLLFDRENEMVSLEVIKDAF